MICPSIPRVVCVVIHHKVIYHRLICLDVSINAFVHTYQLRSNNYNNQYNLIELIYFVIVKFVKYVKYVGSVCKINKAGQQQNYRFCLSHLKLGISYLPTYLFI